MIEEMRQLVRAWTEAPADSQRKLAIRANVLNKDTRARMADVVRRGFLPRFLEGPLPNAWKLVRPLEDAEAPLLVLRPVYYWITAKAEPLIADFCREYLMTHVPTARAGIGVPEVLSWLRAKGCDWSPAVSTKVVCGLLAALRDFGILEGRAKKRLASVSLPIGAFAYIGFCLQQAGVSSRSLVGHADWRLFLLQPGEVEHLFLVAHQHRLLEYYAAGSTVNITFPALSLEQYAHVVVQRSN